MCVDFGVRQLRLGSRLWHLLAGGPWTSRLTFSVLLPYALEAIRVTRQSWDDVNEASSFVLQRQQTLENC